MANISLAEQHLDEAVDLLSMTTIIASLYTFVFILYCLSFRLSYAQLWDHNKIKRQTARTVVLATVLLICATLDVIVWNRVAQVMYIDNSPLPGAPLSPPTTFGVPALVKLDSIVNIVENLLILGVLLWRVRVVWSGTRFIIPLTIVSLFFYLVNAGLAVSYYVITWNSGSSSLRATPRAKAMLVMLESIFSIAGLVFMTSAIIARLLFIRRKHIKLMGKSDIAGQYLGIAAMLIESYALDTLWHIGLLISFGLKFDPATNLFGACVIQVDILTNFLLIYRVLSGRAWERQTQSRLSTLIWASDGPDTTTSGTVDMRQTGIPEENPPVVSFRDGV